MKMHRPLANKFDEAKDDSFWRSLTEPRNARFVHESNPLRTVFRHL